jgi:hypothetical protein
MVPQDPSEIIPAEAVAFAGIVPGRCGAPKPASGRAANEEGTNSSSPSRARKPSGRPRRSRKRKRPPRQKREPAFRRPSLRSIVASFNKPFIRAGDDGKPSEKVFTRHRRAEDGE